jgi:hypothetical protein
MLQLYPPVLQVPGAIVTGVLFTASGLSSSGFPGGWVSAIVAILRLELMMFYRLPVRQTKVKEVPDWS